MPQAIKNAGLDLQETKYHITEEVKDYIIQNYSREPGMRSLKKFINRITEKIAYNIVDQEESTKEVVVDVDNIEKYIGHPLYRSSKFYTLYPPPGVVIGLAYNEYGGAILYIESARSSFGNEGKGGLRVTGSLGDVMKESSSIAQTYAKKFLATYINNNVPAQKYLESHDIHIHFPEGAILLNWLIFIQYPKMDHLLVQQLRLPSYPQLQVCQYHRISQ